MKNTFFRLTAAVLALVMLIPAVFAAPDQEPENVTQLFHWQASSAVGNNMTQIRDNLRQSTNVAVTHWAYDLTVNTAEGAKEYTTYNLLNTASSSYGLPYEAYNSSKTKSTEAMRLEFLNFPRIRIREEQPVNLSMVYAVTPSRIDMCVFALDKFMVQFSLDGENWLEGGAGIRSWELIGNAVDEKGQDVYLFRLETENFLDVESVLPGDRIRGLRILPFGEYYYTFGTFGMSEVTVNSYASEEAFEEAVPNERDDLLNIGEEQMRDIVTQHAEMYANIPWVSDATIYSDYQALGSTNVNYNTYGKGILTRGLVYNRVAKVDYEIFRDAIKDGKYMGGYTTGSIMGADCMSYAYDAYSRVSRSYSFVIWQTQSDNALQLMGGLKTDESPTFTNTDIIPFNTEQEMFEAYALMEKADIMTNYTTLGGIHIRIAREPATVVRNPDGTIDPNKSYVITYEQSSGTRYYFETSDGSEVWVNNNIIAPENALADIEEYLAEHPGYRFLYSTGTHCNTKYTFRDLLNTYYVPLTLKEYESGKVEDVDVQMLLQPKDYKDITSGFRAVAVADCHVIRLGVALEDMATGRVLFEDEMLSNNAQAGNVIHQRNYAWNYDSAKLDAKLASLPNGSYRIAVSVQAGPVTEARAERPVTTEYYTFSVSNSADALSATLISSAQSVAAGQTLEVQVNADSAFTAADVEVEYDADKLTFNGGSLIPTCMVNSIDAEGGIVRIMAVDAAANSGELVKLTFTAKSDVNAADAVGVKSAVIAAGEGGGSQPARPGSYSKLTVSANGSTLQVDNVNLTDSDKLMGQSFNNAESAKHAGWTVEAGKTSIREVQTGRTDLAGKTVSVFGDSISTYEGYSNNAAANSTMGGNAVYYPKNAADMRVEDTWWMQVVDQTGMKLLVNNSYSGDELNLDEDPGKGLERVTQLHSNDGTKPDVILVCFGTNDAAANQKIANNQQVFSTNYGKMLTKLAETYPDAQVLLLNLPARDWYDVTPYNNIIKNLAAKSGKNFHVVDIYNQTGITASNVKQYTYDGLHPNPTGMDLFTKAVCGELDKLGTQDGWNTSKVMELTGDSAASYGLSGNYTAAQLSFDLCFDGFGGSVGLYSNNKATASLRVMNDGTGKGKLQYFNSSWADTGVTGLEPGSWYTVGMTFTPGSAVTITVDGKQAGTAALNTETGHSCSASAMTDVVDDAWYHTAVDYALDNGIMSGYNATTFGPNDELSRAMVVQVLYNKEGQPTVSGAHGFPDVKSGDWFNNAVTWGSQKGVVGGYGDGRFGPDDDVTIEQIAVILWNYSGNPEGTGELTSVGAHSDWAANALRWAAGEGLFKDMPYDAVTVAATRAQTAQMLMNFLNK